ncbi:hypothetical protein MSG28_011688 [Choristoneura fumiferana]|uniref:Uncharacterized protein n=1 Tax=Choristoneura fumiferana TaxID=7141 RepID=A0ACC0KLE0_CHOFU|nr:hypothetical protein MSG28_011688 [Choristoneura fumiferana]
MSELFNIFGDHVTRLPAKNVARQPLHNIENMGKSVSMGPIKPNEPLKKGAEPKKSFLCNTGKALQSTPMRQVFTPRPVNVGALIYNDADAKSDDAINFEEIEFTRPVYRYDNYHKDALDYLPLPGHDLRRLSLSPPRTPAPDTRPAGVDFDCSYQDEFFTDEFSNESIPDPDDSDLGLPAIY